MSENDIDVLLRFLQVIYLVSVILGLWKYRSEGLLAILYAHLFFLHVLGATALTMAVISAFFYSMAYVVGAV